MNGLVIFFEVLSSLAGLAALCVAISKLRSLAATPLPDEAWAKCLIILFWSVGAAFCLSVTVLIGDYGLSVLYLLYFIVAMLMFLTVWFAARVRSAPARALKRSAVPAAGMPTVVIKSLVPGRVRGFSEEGDVVLSAEENSRVVGLEGFAKLFSFQSMPSGLVGVAPLLGFWNDAGTSLLIYHDDEITLKG